MTKYTINPNYEVSFKEFLLNIKDNFKKNNQTIHKARNELKVINFNNLDVVVKSFKVPNIINRFAYSFFKSSKAKKSYEYSLKIGDFTPQPIGFIEFYANGLLEESYFISENFKYDFTIREPLISSYFEAKNELLRAFAKFTFELHQNNILHYDYSPGNILVKKVDDGYRFKIVDINRMKFIPLSTEDRLKNFSKLWMRDEDLSVVADEYSNLISKDSDECIKIALSFSHKHKSKINMKKRLKGIEVVD